LMVPSLESFSHRRIPGLVTADTQSYAQITSYW